MFDLDDVDFDNDIQSYDIAFTNTALVCNGEDLSRLCVNVFERGNLPSNLNKKVSSIACL